MAPDSTDRHLTVLVHDLLNIADGHTGSSHLSTNEARAEKAGHILCRESRHSREELNEFVMNIRGLSNRLSNLKLKPELHQVMIVAKLQDKDIIGKTRDFASLLLKRGICTYVQKELAAHSLFDLEGLMKDAKNSDTKFHTWSEVNLPDPNKLDLVVTLGGDGTVLFVSWLFQQIVPPVVSFGLGSLGFLTEYEWDNREETIDSIAKNGIYLSLRMRFECRVIRAVKDQGEDWMCRDLDEEIRSMVTSHNSTDNLDEYSYDKHYVDATHAIFNDLVVDRGTSSTMTTTELYTDFDHLTTVQADGLVIATPSGSTAYSLSAGGSLVHPDIPGILISPICPHTLSFRPVVVPDNTTIRIGVPYDARASAYCSFDGRARIELTPGDFITVTASRFPFPKVQSEAGSEWYSGLSNTLNWNQRKRQKRFTNI
ncbi:putative kinase C1B1.02c [Yarrowia sp. B02]|nr:putative kinase C1B1.02c [Yarrowia sp. B02]